MPPPAGLFFQSLKHEQPRSCLVTSLQCINTPRKHAFPNYYFVYTPRRVPHLEIAENKTIAFNFQCRSHYIEANTFQPANASLRMPAIPHNEMSALKQLLFAMQSEFDLLLEIWKKLSLRRIESKWIIIMIRLNRLQSCQKRMINVPLNIPLPLGWWWCMDMTNGNVTNGVGHKSSTFQFYTWP